VKKPDHIDEVVDDVLFTHGIMLYQKPAEKPKYAKKSKSRKKKPRRR